MPRHLHGFYSAVIDNVAFKGSSGSAPWWGCSFGYGNHSEIAAPPPLTQVQAHLTAGGSGVGLARRFNSWTVAIFGFDHRWKLRSPILVLAKIARRVYATLAVISNRQSKGNPQYCGGGAVHNHFS